MKIAIYTRVSTDKQTEKPTECAVKKWRPVILNPRTTPARKKQALVALARIFGIDWWRLRTGQTTAQQTGTAHATIPTNLLMSWLNFKGTFQPLDAFRSGGAFALRPWVPPPRGLAG